MRLNSCYNSVFVTAPRDEYRVMPMHFITDIAEFMALLNDAEDDIISISEETNREILTPILTLFLLSIGNSTYVTDPFTRHSLVSVFTQSKRGLAWTVFTNPRTSTSVIPVLMKFFVDIGGRMPQGKMD